LVFSVFIFIRLFISLVVSVFNYKFQTAASRTFWYPGFEVACPPFQSPSLYATACMDGHLSGTDSNPRSETLKFPLSTSASFLVIPYLSFLLTSNRLPSPIGS